MLKSVESLDKTKTLNKPKRSLADIAGGLLHEVQQAASAKDQQRILHERWYKKRMGIRPPKTFPWPGCANIHLPLVDKTIKKLAPLYSGIIDIPGKVAVFRPAPKNPNLLRVKGRAELFFSHLIQDVMNSHPSQLGISESFALGADKMLEKGYFIAKIVWSTVNRRKSEFFDVLDELGDIDRAELTDEDLESFIISKIPFLDPDDEVDSKAINKAISQFRSGKEIIEIRYNATVYDAPLVIARDPSQIDTPTDTTNLSNARWIGERQTPTTNDLRIDARSGKYKKSVVEAYLADKESSKAQTDQNLDDSNLEALKKVREGISDIVDMGSDTHLIREIGFWHDIDNDGIEEKCVITFPDSHPEHVFRLIELPFDHGEWPWVDFPMELIDERYTASRGVPEHLDHLQTIITAQHNFKLDSMTITNAPVLKSVIGGVNPGNINFKPGGHIPVIRSDALEPLRWDRPDMSFEREEANLKAWAEEYMGQIDSSLSSSTNPTQESRTKFELQTVVSERTRIFSHNAKIFMRRLRKVYEQIWELWVQYGDEEMEIFVTDEPLNIKKSDFKGKFYIFPAGTPESVNPVTESQQALQDIQMFKGDPMVNQEELRNRYWRVRDPLSAQQMVIESPQMSAAQVERQVLEIAQMELGFDTPIKPDDQDEPHLQVIQKYLDDVRSGRRQSSEETLRMVVSHAKFHQARLAQQQGQSGQAEKARTEANQVRGLPE